MMIKRWMTVFLVLALLLMPGQAAWARANSLSMQPRITDSAGADPALAQSLAVGETPAGLSGQEWSRMQAQMQAARYQFTWQARDGVWAYRAPNLALGLELALGKNGLSAVYYGEKGYPAWQFGLRLTAYGKQPMPETLPDRALHAQRDRVAYAWNAQVTEWYRNTSQGVEHGVTLFAPPADGPVQLDFALTGDLRAEADDDNGALLRTSDGTAVLRYDQLAVYDHSGKLLAARMAPTPGGLRITIDAAGAAYPLAVDPLLHTQAVQLHASTPVPGAEFGHSVAVSGDVLVVGAPNEDVGTTYNIGAAYVFHRDQSTPGAWGEVQILRADDGQAGDNFGWSVAISGDVIVVGALNEDGGAGDPRVDAGAAYVFQRVLGGADDWEQQVILRASDAAADDQFGRSVAISGDVIVVGTADKNSLAGVAYVFERGLSWGQVKILQATGATVGDIFGGSVAVDGDVIVVGASCVDGAAADAGAAYVFQRNQGGANNWGQAAILYASDARANDRLGGSVAISGDVIVAGATGINVVADPGAAYVFQRQQGGANHWGQVRKLTASDAKGGDSFGGSVAVSGDVIVVGAANNDSAAHNAGAMYVFQRNLGGGNRWGQSQNLHAADAQASDGFGRAVAISGDVIVAGAPVEAGSGAVYVFQRTENDAWRETALTHSSEIQTSDNFGDSVAISGDVLVVGAYGEDYGDGDAFPGAGAAYVFQRDQGGAGNWGEVPAILRDSDPQEEGHFSSSVAVSGDVIVVGEPYKDVAAQDDGAVFIFERDQGGANQWYEVKTLQIPAGAADDRFGSAVAVSGDVVVVGALYKDIAEYSAGAVYVYQRDQGGANNWGLVKTLQSADIGFGDNFGRSVAVSGEVIVVGAWFEDDGGSDAGAAYVFQRSYGGIDNWGQVKKLNAPVPVAGAHFGVSVAVAGDVIAVGANAQDGYTGAAYVFHRDEGGAGNWGWMQTLAPDEIRANSSFGLSVAVSRDVIVVGAPSHDGPEEDPLESAGAAFVFRRNEGGIDLWDLLTTLRASDAQENDYFGAALGASGDVIVAGAYGEDGGLGDPVGAAGAVYIFQSAPLVHLYLPLVLRAS